VLNSVEVGRLNYLNRQQSNREIKSESQDLCKSTCVLKILYFSTILSYKYDICLSSKGLFGIYTISFSFFFFPEIYTIS